MEEPHSFGRVLRDALIARDITTGMGNPNWSAFAEMLEGVHYETLRKAVTGDRAPAPALMEEIASALGVEPTIFVEYRLYEARKQFDPQVVGLEAAEENLRRFGQSAGKRRR